MVEKLVTEKHEAPEGIEVIMSTTTKKGGFSELNNASVRTTAATVFTLSILLTSIGMDVGNYTLNLNPVVTEAEAGSGYYASYSNQNQIIIMLLFQDIEKAKNNASLNFNYEYERNGAIRPLKSIKKAGNTYEFNYDYERNGAIRPLKSIIFVNHPLFHNSP